jgi:hypothetical protein
VRQAFATSVTFISSTEIRAQVPALDAGTYVVYVSNSDGAVAIRVNGLTFSSEPTWVTDSSLPNGDSGTAISIQLIATSATVYTLQSGSTLPENLTLSSGGLLSGTVTIDNETLYNFTVVATDAEFQDSPRTFSITITSGDLFFNSTTLLLSGSADTFVKDASTNNFPVTVVGDTKPNNFGPYTPGYYSNYFDGTGDELTLASSSAFNFGAGDFTVEMWVNLEVTNIQGQYFFYATGYNPNMFLWNNGVIYLRTAETSGEIVTPTASGIVAGRWHHLACVRSGNTYSIYRDGVLVVSGSSTAVTNADSQLFFGKNLKGSAAGI